MIRLSATTHKLQAVLAGAVTTNQLHCVVCYSDDNGTTYVGGTQLTSTNDTTAVDICAAPAASTVRDIDNLSIRNRDTAEATVTVMLDSSGADSEIVRATLAVGDSLIYTHGDGWRAVDSFGQVKSGFAVPDGDKGDITVSSGTWTIDAGAVTLAKMANLAQDQFIGRITASTGGPETATITAAARTVLDDATVADMRTTLGAASLAANTFTGEQIISVNSSSDAFRITQTGAGNALIVEDSAYPDSTPFVIDASGIVIAGHTSTVATVNAGNGSQESMKSQIHGTTTSQTSKAQIIYDTTAPTVTAPYVQLGRSNNATIGSHGIASSGDLMGGVSWCASDGSNFIRSAAIEAYVDNTTGTNDMPGRLVFSTTADGASSPTERMRIDSYGNVTIGTSPAAGRRFYLYGPITGATGCYAALVGGEVRSDVTSACFGVATSVATEAASFTLTSLIHFAASQSTIGAGSTVSNQYGFYVGGTLVGATNNFGFYSNIPTSSGRWNFYASGTAPNYFAGDVRCNTVVTQATSPTNSDTTATATASSLLGGIRTGTPTANIDLQLPTGTNMDAAFTSLQNNQSFEWSVINLAAATYAITVTANTNHAVVGNMIVDASKSGRFLTRKGATNTFTTYRIA